MTKFNRSRVEDGEYNFIAGVGLIKASRLLFWDGKKNCFRMPGIDPVTGIPDEKFEQAWQRFDPHFGRVVFWNTFSNGAEYLIKGLLLAHDLDGSRELNTAAMTLQPSPQQLSTLAARAKLVRKQDAAVFKSWARADYGSLGDAMNAPWKAMWTRKYGSLPKNSAERHALESEADIIYAAYDVLRSSIRNRDTHAYVPNVRENHRYLVEGLFLPAFNLVLKWMPDPNAISEMINRKTRNSHASEPVSEKGEYDA
ncbi:hypothetical protein QZM81_16280 [Burkholderia cepacia]|uniref:Uncharacterized protein n=1 Tax=Burkholderia cepacia TaxID=292 RepID=A0AAQ0FQK5_BURCE|nr:hypothetical protein [Burkholderia cepacia]MDN7857360.1 hypothetical protein [Burkholderia cepacia]QFS40762.1 hypothetical protein BURCE16_28585 [Burkholderia cepacia]RAQ16378.1 hypothetical protein DPR02_01145 [Burkholderia cepacia]